VRSVFFTLLILFLPLFSGAQNENTPWVNLSTIYNYNDGFLNIKQGTTIRVQKISPEYFIVKGQTVRGKEFTHKVNMKSHQFLEIPNHQKVYFTDRTGKNQELAQTLIIEKSDGSYGTYSRAYRSTATNDANDAKYSINERYSFQEKVQNLKYETQACLGKIKKFANDWMDVQAGLEIPNVDSPEKQIAKPNFASSDFDSLFAMIQPAIGKPVNNCKLSWEPGKEMLKHKAAVKDLVDSINSVTEKEIDADRVFAVDVCARTCYGEMGGTHNGPNQAKPNDSLSNAGRCSYSNGHFDSRYLDSTVATIYNRSKMERQASFGFLPAFDLKYFGSSKERGQLDASNEITSHPITSSALNVRQYHNWRLGTPQRRSFCPPASRDGDFYEKDTMLKNGAPTELLYHQLQVFDQCARTCTLATFFEKNFEAEINPQYYKAVSKNPQAEVKRDFAFLSYTSDQYKNQFKNWNGCTRLEKKETPSIHTPSFGKGDPGPNRRLDNPWCMGFYKKTSRINCVPELEANMDVESSF